MTGKFDGVYCLDVLEHIKKSEEPVFFRNILSGARKIWLWHFWSSITGVAEICFCSKQQGHVNCMTQPDLRATLEKYFYNVFLFFHE